MAAHKAGHGNFHIATSQENVEKNSPLYVGKVEKQGTNDVFVLFGRGENYRKQKGGFDKTSALPQQEKSVVVLTSPCSRTPTSPCSRTTTSSISTNTPPPWPVFSPHSSLNSHKPPFSPQSSPNSRKPPSSPHSSLNSHGSRTSLSDNAAGRSPSSPLNRTPKSRHKRGSVDPEEEEGSGRGGGGDRGGGGENAGRALEGSEDNNSGGGEEFDPFGEHIIGSGDGDNGSRGSGSSGGRGGGRVDEGSCMAGDQNGESLLREQLGLVTFAFLEEFWMALSVFVPPVSRSGQRQCLRPTRLCEDILCLRDTQPHALVQLISRRPTPNPETGVLQMDFGGRAPIPSIKNQQIIMGSNPDLTVEQRPSTMQFGKMAEDCFSLDLCWPLCPFQAFALALIVFFKQ